MLVEYLFNNDSNEQYSCNISQLLFMIFNKFAVVIMDIAVN